MCIRDRDSGEDLGDDLAALLDDTADEASTDEIDSLIADDLSMDVADDVSAALEAEAPSLTSETALDIETMPDADDDLDALLDDIDLDEAVDSIEEVEATELETAETEEDADLLLVKTLMADLADYNTSDVSSDFEDLDIETAEDDISEDDTEEDALALEALTEDSIDEVELESELDGADDELAALDDELDGLIESVEAEGVSPEMPLDEASLDDTPLEAFSPEIETEDVSVEASNEDLLSDIPDDIDAEDDEAILDEILDMTFEDELTSAEDVAALELENIAENTALEDSLSDAVQNEALIEDSQPMSLSDIAAAASADAAATGSVGLGAAIAGAGAAALGTAAIAGSDNDFLGLNQFDENAVAQDALAQDDDVEQIIANILDGDAAEDDIPDDEIFDLENFATPPEEEVAETIAAPETHNTLESTEETPEMPRAAAKKKEAIMDEVEGAATTSVFAQLNQVVEEKAVSAERGDRVGDLVMELLEPMLKEWLDKNLKGIVERAVTKEVKRISSGK